MTKVNSAWAISALFPHGPKESDERRLIGIGWLYHTDLPSIQQYANLCQEYAGTRILLFRTRAQARAHLHRRFGNDTWARETMKPRVEKVSITIQVI